MQHSDHKKKSSESLNSLAKSKNFDLPPADAKPSEVPEENFRLPAVEKKNLEVPADFGLPAVEKKPIEVSEKDFAMPPPSKQKALDTETIATAFADQAPAQPTLSDAQKIEIAEKIQQQQLSRDQAISWTFRRLHWLGWFFLLLFFMNLVEPIALFKPFDPQSHWLFQQTLLGNSWQLLLAVALLLTPFAVPTQAPKHRLFTLTLRIFLWVSLLSYALLLPWMIGTAFRMQTLELAKFDQVNAERSRNLDSWQERTAAIKTPADLQAVLAKAATPGQTLPVIDEENFSKFFEEFQTALQKEVQDFADKRQTFQNNAQWLYWRKGSVFVLIGLATLFILGVFGRTLHRDLDNSF